MFGFNISTLLANIAYFIGWVVSLIVDLFVY